MIKYMTLIRGDAEVTYPIYQISDLTKMSLSVAGLTSDSIKFVAYGCSPTSSPDGVQAAFADEIPTTPAEYGNITQNNLRFVLDTATQKQYCPDAHFVAVPIGTKPDDWDTNYMDYYGYQTGQVGNWGNVPIAVYPTTNPNEIPAWNSTAQYYKMDTATPQERINHLFFTKSGYSVGVWSMSGQGEGDAAYCHASYIACNPRENAVMNDSYSYIWRDQNGNPMTHQSIIPAAYYAYWRTNCMDISTPAAGAQVGTTRLTDDRRDMQLFCWTEYNGELYYGVIAVAIDSNGALTNARALMFTHDFWGESVSDTPPEPEPQGGEWGASTQRAGGQGQHAASSDSRGDRAGTTVRDIMSSRDSALALAFDTPFMRTYSFDNLTRTQIAEIFAILYGTDYWSLFQNQMLNPLSSIVAFHLIPSTLRGANLTLEDLIIGPKNISAAMTGAPQVTKIKQIKWYHIGTVDMSDVLLPYFDAYPDFAPYTDIILHLPYIGDIKIDVNAVMYGALSVEYACDNVSGNVAAWIYCEDRYPEPQTHKQYKYIATGNCAYSIPLFAQSQNGMDVGKIIGSGVGIVGGVATGNLAAAVSGAMGIGSALYEHSRAPINTQQTGGSSGNVAILGDTDVWIEVIRPQWIQPESYQQLVGIPSGLAGTLSDIHASGRVVCSDIETDGIAATEPELREIERLLLSGIYLKPQP